MDCSSTTIARPLEYFDLTGCLSGVQADAVSRAPENRVRRLSFLGLRSRTSAFALSTSAFGLRPGASGLVAGTRCTCMCTRCMFSLPMCTYCFFMKSITYVAWVHMVHMPCLSKKRRRVYGRARLASQGAYMTEGRNQCAPCAPCR